MDEREQTIMTEVVIMRGLAKLEFTMYDRMMVETSPTDALISESRQASRLYQLYEGVVGLGRNSAWSWSRALTIARDAAESSAEKNEDEETRLACQKFLRQTQHL